MSHVSPATPGLRHSVPTNCNPDTLIAYGVVSLQSLDSDLAQDLMFGPDAIDLDYQEAYECAKRDAIREFEASLEDAEIAANETDHLMSDTEREDFIAERISEKYPDYPDLEDHVDAILEQFSDTYESNQPTIEGTYEGVKYRISWLGGAPILWVFEGPIGYCRSQCSPCVPGAGDLDSGFVKFEDASEDYPYICYIVPHDWLANPQVRS